MRIMCITWCLLALSCAGRIDVTVPTQQATDPVQPPTLSYLGTESIQIKVGKQQLVSPTQILSNGSTIISCDATPSLPAGLSLSSSCIISGKAKYPQVGTDYTITATNAVGTSSPTTLRIEIGETTIYRSVGVGTTSAIAESGSNGDMTISKSIATFSTPLPNNQGIGDAVQYDSDGDSIIDSIAFIHWRFSSTEFLLLAADGDFLSDASSISTWATFRATTSIANAEAGIENTGIDASVRNFDSWSGGANLVSMDKIWAIALYADNADTTRVDISGWTTDVDHPIKIFVPRDIFHVGTSQRHNGRWSDSAARLVTTSTTTYRPSIRSFEPNIILEGLQIEINNAGYEHNGAFALGQNNLFTNTASLDVSYCIVRQGANSSAYAMTAIAAAFAQFPYSSRTRIWNNIIEGFNLQDIAGSGTGIVVYGEAHIYNNTIHNCRVGVRAAEYDSYNPTTVLLNNNILTSTVDDLSGLTLFSTLSDYNSLAIDDEIATLGIHNTELDTVQFVDSASGDFSLDLSDIFALGTGVDLSSNDIIPYDDNIKGEFRTFPWNRGAL